MNKFEISKSVESFIKFLEIEEKSIATINKYKRDLKYFINWLSNTEITKATVIKFKAATILLTLLGLYFSS